MTSRIRLRRLSATLWLVVVAVACAKARQTTTTTPSGPAIVITGASLDATNHVVANYTLTQNGQGVTDNATASSLAPSWTLAGLSVDPATVGLPADPASRSGFVRPPVPAWKSYLLTGSGVLKSLPIDGPATDPAFVLTNTHQPGSESGGQVQNLGGGNYSYTYQNALPSDLDKSQTLRVGAWLGGTPGTAQTSSTFDFVPGGGAVQGRELVLDANCNKCHGLLQAHGGFRTGVKLCLTCHTYQNADPDTVDPAAMTGSTAETNPNPLDLGRLVHQIHRGKELPTLYTTNGPTTPGGSRANVTPPFFPGVNKPLVGQKYSIVGFQKSELVFGQVVNRTDNNQAPLAVAQGVGFPHDLRDCEACHGGAAQAQERFADISRRTCAGCHTDAWFQDPSLITDKVHYMHPGDIQPDDSTCYGCHVPRTEVPSVDADITSLHVAIINSPNWNGLTVQIAGVQNMTPGQKPTVLFTITDRDGPLSPLNSPTPVADPTSPVPRKLSRVAITISGPTSPDYQTGNFVSAATAPVTESVPLTTAAGANGQFSYTFSAALPANATGTWAVGIEARRSAATTAYDPGSDSYSWPFTSETLNEYADNPVQYVDVSTGTAPGGNPKPRRQVVSRDNCNACHMMLTAHGDLRHNVEYCVMCHAPDATDWDMRPKGTDGNVALGKTFDNIEERTIDFMTLIARIHTGAHTGSANLEVAHPFVVYGFGGTPNFFDDVRFPGDLANCNLCHVNGTYAIESVPTSALPIVANETATIQHQASAAHASTEPSDPRIQAACFACHDTEAAQAHAAQMNAQEGAERCADCHGLNAGSLSVKTVHGLQ